MNNRQKTLYMACTSALLLGTLTPPLAAQNAGGGGGGGYHIGLGQGDRHRHQY